MLRSRRSKQARAHLKAGISLAAAAATAAGVFSGASAVSANRLGTYKLFNRAVLLFVERLNAVFFRYALLGAACALLLFVIHRIAPRSFRRITSILFLVASLLLIAGNGLFGGEADSVRGAILLQGRRALLVLAALAAARIFHEIQPAFRAILSFGSLRVILLPLFILAVANSGAYINRTKNFPRGKNVILVTIDGIRPDRMSAYGYERPTTPHLDRLAAEGILFSRAFSPSPMSRSSLAAILTGLYPADALVRRWEDRLPTGRTTLGEVLEDRGYDTAGFAVLDGPPGSSGLDQGFNLYREAGTIGADSLTSEAIRWIRERGKRPFFLWIHYDDPVTPYEPGPEGRIFGDGGYEGPYRDRFVYRPTRGCRVFDLLPLNEADRHRALDLYDGEIRTADARVGRVLAALREGDRIDDSIVLVAGTHGQSLGEHGYHFDHGEFLYDPSLRVPVLLSAPNLPRQVLEAQIRLIDLAPTLLDILRYEIPFDTEGRSLMPVVERPNRPRSFPLFAETGPSLLFRYNERRPVAGMEGRLRSVRLEGWKLILTPGAEGPLFELYDLENDPEESRNVAAERPEKRAELASLLEGWAAEKPAPGPSGDSPPPDWVLSRGE